LAGFGVVSLAVPIAKDKEDAAATSRERADGKRQFHNLHPGLGSPHPSGEGARLGFTRLAESARGGQKTPPSNGRKTYDIFAGDWPYVPADNPIGPVFTKANKYVLTRGSAKLDWANSHKMRNIDDLRKVVNMKLVRNDTNSRGVIMTTYEPEG
jgi:hypothetical protein